MVFPRLDPIGRKAFTSFSLPEDAPQRYEREAVQALALMPITGCG